MNIGDRVRFTGYIKNLPVNHLGRNEPRAIIRGGTGTVVEVSPWKKKDLLIVNFDDSVFNDTVVSSDHVVPAPDAPHRKR